MGDWNVEPWGNDEAADWFHRFWQGANISQIINEIRDFDEKHEAYDSFRAASYVLQSFGHPYLWPSAYRLDLKPLLDRSIEILTCMIEPPNANWGFLEMWGHDPKIIISVRFQIEALKQRRFEIATWTA